MIDHDRPLRPRVIAHRGSTAAGVVENTLAAFELAVLLGAEMIELDVRRTAAGELIVIHDQRNGAFTVGSVDVDELAGALGFRPPLLVDVLAWARGRVALDVELKEAGYVGELLEPLRAFADGGGELLVTSFLDPVLTELHTRAPELELGLLITWSALGVVRRARACGATIVLPDVRLAKPRLLRTVAAAGFDLIVWDFMPDADAALLDDARIDAVITDDVATTLAGRSALRSATRS